MIVDIRACSKRPEILVFDRFSAQEASLSLGTMRNRLYAPKYLEVNTNLDNVFPAKNKKNRLSDVGKLPIVDYMQYFVRLIFHAVLIFDGLTCKY